MPSTHLCSEDQGLFPGTDLPLYTRELKYGSPQHPIRWAEGKQLMSCSRVFAAAQLPYLCLAMICWHACWPCCLES